MTKTPDEGEMIWIHQKEVFCFFISYENSACCRNAGDACKIEAVDSNLFRSCLSIAREVFFPCQIPRMSINLFHDLGYAHSTEV